MKLATWNVNSIRAREERLLRWAREVRAGSPVPAGAEGHGRRLPPPFRPGPRYHAAVHGQKTYNGVAVLSRVERSRSSAASRRRRRRTGAPVAARVGRVHVVSGTSRTGRRSAPEVGLQGRVAEAAAGLARPSFREDRPRWPSAGISTWPPKPATSTTRRVEPSVLFHPEARAALEHVRAWASSTPSACTHQARLLHVVGLPDARFPKGRGSASTTCPERAARREVHRRRIDRDERKASSPPITRRRGRAAPSEELRR